MKNHPTIEQALLSRLFVQSAPIRVLKVDAAHATNLAANVI